MTDDHTATLRTRRGYSARASFRCACGATFQARLRRVDGWESPEWEDHRTSLGLPKPGLVSNEPKGTRNA